MWFRYIFLSALLFCYTAVADETCPVGYGYKTTLFATEGGCVDLGMLDWILLGAANDNRIWSPNAQENLDAIGGNNLFSVRYKQGAAQAGVDKTIIFLNNNIYLADNDFIGKNVNEIKTLLSGVILYYQRETDSTWVPPITNPICHTDTLAYSIYGNYELPETSDCVLCPPNTYKDFVGNAECTPCPNGTMSPSGATNIDQCGHILHIGGYVAFMPVDKRTEHGLCTMLDNIKYCADLYEKQ